MAIRSMFILLCVGLIGSRLAAEPSKEMPLTPIDARKEVDKTILVQMEVRAAKDRLDKRGEIYLDCETDFRDEKNFAVVITKRGAQSLAENQIREPAEYFQGKVIQARGKVKEVDGVPRIEVDDAKQIRLIEKPKSP